MSKVSFKIQNLITEFLKTPKQVIYFLIQEERTRAKYIQTSGTYSWSSGLQRAWLFLPIHLLWCQASVSLHDPSILGTPLQLGLHLCHWPLLAFPSLSFFLWCLQNPYHLEKSYTLPSSASSLRCSLDPSGPQLLCANPEEMFPRRECLSDASLLLISVFFFFSNSS